MTARNLVAGGAVAALLLSATSTNAASKPKTHTIAMIDAMHFEPESVTVRPGDTIVWVNKDVVQHTATAANGAFNSPAVAPGGSWKLTLRRKGSLVYSCRFHPMMKGEVKVQ